MEELLDVLPGEGETKTETLERKRICCGECGEAAYYQHNYLLPNARSNPASSGYEKDDISWCSDIQAYACKTCKKPEFNGYSWCGTFKAVKSFAHMFLEWQKKGDL